MAMDFSEICSRISENLQKVNFEIETACLADARDPASVRLVAVTKYAEWDWVRALSQEHVSFGENRPQQLAERTQLEGLCQPAEWHLIGQLQRNKARIAVEHAALIHSVDTLRLLQRIGSVATECDRLTHVLLQVNVSGEESKSGFSPEQLRDFFPEICEVRSVRIDGLMTMAPAGASESETYECFCGLRQLRDTLRETPAAFRAEYALPELSMGMSRDFASAIRAGATIVRIGSRLYEGLNTD